MANKKCFDIEAKKIILHGIREYGVSHNPWAEDPFIGTQLPHLTEL